jgi:polyribonucleotide nucleotidyltransferase
MFDIKKKTIDWAGKKLTLETGRMARQADGAVLATYGETTVLATVVFAKAPKPGLDFFPLTVNYQEKTYAAGKTPGGFFKREGRPTEKETLVSRLIDRPIRPLFVKGFKHETQVVINVLSHDLENDPDIVAMVAASAALTLSGVPFMGPIGAARVGMIDGEYVLNPTLDQMADTKIDLVVAATHDAVMMVESEIQELNEEQVLGAVAFAHEGLKPVIEAIIELADHAAKEPYDFQAESFDDLTTKIQTMVGAELRAAYEHKGKAERHDGISAAKSKAAVALVKSDTNPDGYDSSKFSSAFKEAEANILRRDIIEHGKRVDGRPLDKVRQIVSEPTARRCLRAARPKRWWWPPLAPARTSSGSTPLKAPIRRSSSCTTTSLPSPSVRPAAWAPLAAAKSVTASWPGGRCVPCCRPPPSSRTRSVSSPRFSSPTAPPRWLRSAAARLL